jgi:uncharacterized membrane protein (UPF0127 family)
MKRVVLFLAVGSLLLVLGIAGWRSNLNAPADAPVFPHDHLIIARADGKQFPFAIEVATTPAQHEYGLMHRHALAADAGMIFLYDPPDTVSMWMKDTPLPLDMLFVRADGTIEKIATHAVPFDVTPIEADEPVRAVIELNAGTADRLGLKTGDKVVYAGFSKH